MEADLLEAAAGWSFRSFIPGVDDQGLLRVNNLAFDWHPDQGDWDEQRLGEAMAETWFDAEDVIVHDPGGRPGWIDGFCWTRRVPATDSEPTMGEIHVIGTDPGSSGRGLGRALAVAGLAHQTANGAEVATLFVEHGNEAAQRLYASLGFSCHARRGGYTAEPAP